MDRHRAVVAAFAFLCLLLAGQGVSAAQSQQFYNPVETKEPDSPHVARAVELYAQGPSAAPQILAELDQAIADDRGDIGAYLLKAITLQGTSRCKDALLVLDELDKVLDERQMMNGSARFQRAQCLYAEKRFAEAKQILYASAGMIRRGPVEALRFYDEWLSKVEVAEAVQAGRPFPARIEFCGIQFPQEDLIIEMPLPELVIADAADGAAFHLPPEVPQKVIAVHCERESIVPLANDFQVVAAGHAFRIIADDRRGELSLADGRLRFRMLEGELSLDEKARIDAYVEAAQAHMRAKP